MRTALRGHAVVIRNAQKTDDVRRIDALVVLRSKIFGREAVAPALGETWVNWPSSTPDIAANSEAKRRQRQKGRSATATALAGWLQLSATTRPRAQIYPSLPSPIGSNRYVPSVAARCHRHGRDLGTPLEI